MRLRPISDNIICSDGDFGEQVTAGGIIIKDMMGKSEGITPRWFKVRAVGPDIEWLQPGEWVYVEYGRWTEGFDFDGEKLWKVDPNGCIATAPEKPSMVNISSDVVIAPKKELY
jgi:hypothetical protein